MRTSGHARLVSRRDVLLLALIGAAMPGAADWSSPAANDLIEHLRTT